VVRRASLIGSPGGAQRRRVTRQTQTFAVADLVKTIVVIIVSRDVIIVRGDVINTRVQRDVIILRVPRDVIMFVISFSD